MYYFSLKISFRKIRSKTVRVVPYTVQTLLSDPIGLFYKVALGSFSILAYQIALHTMQRSFIQCNPGLSNIAF